MNSLISLFTVLVCPIIALYFISMTYQGFKDLFGLKNRNDEEAQFLKDATKKQTRKYVICAVIFIALSIAPHIFVRIVAQ